MTEHDRRSDPPSPALTRRQQRALPAVAANTTARRAAAEGGVTERTLYRWMQQAAFRDRAQAERERSFRAASDRRPKGVRRTIDELHAALADERLPVRQRLDAAHGVLSLVTGMLAPTR